ncbi:MAG: MATE family efflux transporter [Clostridiales bacterium]|nr:MATE family efflux transporter [Candidatus Blautia equi]
MTLSEQVRLVISLSIPVILAQISSIIMRYIDTAMVGNMGAEATAAIGLIASSTWLLNGMCSGISTGFSVQVAQMIGAGREYDARNVFRQAIISALIFGGCLTLVGVSISGVLPVWLGGAEEIRANSTRYFRIFACMLWVTQLRQLSSSMLQCSGDIRTPSILNMLMCGLDVVFNLFCIFPTREVAVLGLHFIMPGMGLGVAGAALGTAIAEGLVTVLLLWVVCIRSDKLDLRKRGSWKLQKECLTTAAKVAIPMTFEHVVECSAQVVSTKIVAPLGTISVAANSLAVTAEGLCYMPGYGLAAAATTLVGQSIGAGQKKTARRFARISVVLGMTVMSCTGILMYFLCPYVFRMLTPDQAVQSLGATVLRIELFAEPMFAASIVAAGALRGAGDTLIPCIMMIASMWGIRITMALLLVPRIGLAGFWIAMCTELCVRGILFLIRLLREKWLEKAALV